MLASTAALLAASALAVARAPGRHAAGPCRRGSRTPASRRSPPGSAAPTSSCAVRTGCTLESPRAVSTSCGPATRSTTSAAAPPSCTGVRIGPRFMKARQRIYTRDGRRLGFSTGARLQFKLAHLGLRWWKWYNAARFELWRVDGRGRRTRRVRVGAKIAYCLRDLRRTRPGVPRSPKQRRLSGVQHIPGPAARDARHLARLVRHLPAHLSRAVDRRDRAARLLRLRAHRRSHGTCSTRRTRTTTSPR